VIHAQQPSLENGEPPTPAHGPAHAVPRAAIPFPEAAIRKFWSATGPVPLDKATRTPRTRLCERSSFFPQPRSQGSLLPCAEGDKNKIMQINGKKEGSSALFPKKGRGWGRVSPSRAVLLPNSLLSRRLDD